MRKQLLGIAGLAIGLVMLGGGAASANVAGGPMASSHLELARTGSNQAFPALGQEDDGPVVAGGTLDDGEDLLPQARISIDEAIASAVAAVPGATSDDVGEVDLEYFDGTLVFNVDVGDKDVKVDASTGDVVSTDQDD